MDKKDEYEWFSYVLSEDTADSPLWPVFGELLFLLKKELEALETAKKQEKEIVHTKVPVEGTSWVRIETSHPTRDYLDILVSMNSRASEGIACAVIITLANCLRDFSKSFNASKSKLKVSAVGPLIGAARWADLVVAASNYVRHSDEWEEAKQNGNEPGWKEKLSVETLVASGLSNEEVWGAKLTHLDLIGHLQVNSWDRLLENVSAWLGECLPTHPEYRE